MKANVRRAWRYLSWAVTLIALVGWVLFLRPQSLGGDVSYVVIRGNSMLPTYQNGDLVVVRSAPSYAIGDPVAYRVPDGELGAGTLVVHRILGGDAESGFVLQGDNNEGLDPWFPRAADVVGRTYFHLPVVGRVAVVMHQPIMLGGLAASLMVMSIVSRPSAKKGQAPASDEAAQSPS